MSILLLLWKYRKDVAYILAILSLLGVFLWYRSHLINVGEDRVKSEDARVVAAQIKAFEEQTAKDAEILKEANDAHQAELQKLRADANSHPLPPVRLCHSPGPSPMPAPPGIPRGSDPSTGVLPQGDGVSTDGPDISAGLGLLAERADRLSADARELNSVTHPKP